MIKVNAFYINGVDYSEYVSMPIQSQITEDESLDAFYIELKGIDLKEQFKPFTLALLVLSENNGDTENLQSHYLYIDNDQVSELISLKKYNHNILLVEETKILERYFVDKTVTQPLLDLNIAEPITTNFLKVLYPDQENAIKYEYIDFISQNVDWYKDLYYKNDILTIINADTFKETFDMATTGITTIYSKSIKIIYPNKVESIIEDIGQDTSIELTQNGTYEIIYDFEFTKFVGNNLYTYKSRAIVAFSVIGNINDSDIYDKTKTIKDVIEKLFATTEVLRVRETPKFRVASGSEYEDSEYGEKVDKILSTKSPEFTFTQQSLYEALKLIGDYAHFLPRLKNNTLFLDILGLERETELELEDYMSNTKTQPSNEFCWSLTSNVSNLVQMDDEAQGSVTTPHQGGLRTFRAESGTVRLEDTNIIIPTEDNIEKIIKLEIGFLSDETYVGDITSYVFEETEYQALSSYGTTPYYSKMYALKYKQGQKNITGLEFERQNVISQAFESQAIKNIIFRKTGKDVNWATSLLDSEDVFKLQYRLTYIPSINTTIKQTKPNVEDYNGNISLAYNQGASKVSADHYGENLKGTVAKLGNTELTKVFIVPYFTQIPKVGEIYNGYNISVVKCEYYPYFIKFELGLTKNFNNKSAYIEINNQLRFYEISEKNFTDVYRIYEEYIVIGKEETPSEECMMNSESFWNMLSKPFAEKTNGENISYVMATGYDKEYITTGQFLLPVISIGIGNSMVFTYHYEDNYSAGTEKTSNKTQQLLKYTDWAGEIEQLKLSYGTTAFTPTNYQEAWSYGDVLPHQTGEHIGVMNTNNKGIIILKDNRENINFNYQIHLVTNDNLIIGSGFASRNMLVVDNTSELDYYLYFLPNKLNKFESKVDLTNAIEYGKLTIESKSNNSFKIQDIEFNLDNKCKSWAIVDKDTNKLILGKNIDLEGGTTIAMPYFTAKRKL